MTIDDQLRAHRLFLTDHLRKQTDFSRTDQNRGVPPPPLQKPAPPDSLRVSLPDFRQWQQAIGQTSLVEAIGRRESRRRFAEDKLALAELSFLLWATQGVRRVLGHGHALRNVPSAGARHSFETYLFIRNVTELTPGLYRYLPLEHELVHVRDVPDMGTALIRAAYGQKFVGRSAVTFVWACIPGRMEWRYGLTAHRVILLDAGHVCQNLYLACEAVGAGTCAVAAYDQAELDQLLGVDGEEEFAVYVAPVGKKE
ncbi:SagB/ThcOx family dehydrogenase [Desulfurivibrio alkaliphilus]|uniref:SagB-type dehydrogenase domain protein n=1 Tax=Desulfurivibrio alkaliphilus (strain DSM 19089 / UNIQEM U267 / AHT2) TaxID=589865 RepID=D6Z118_DESAT|nr:SagB/ThcOx family dehydrogenase [Desulfurivibrio alkaliphilus]ADH87278.1 SagB-type dehydrogenase domain protein [Desulfurivibrio alkaliphilus AHT 2]